ncbi:MAG: hypothetical protein ACR2IV_12505 [Bryobacteraceae bacterium]
MEESKYQASKKLLDHVGGLFKGKPEYVLLDEELVVYDKVMQAAEQGVKSKKKLSPVQTARTIDHPFIRRVIVSC